MASVLEFLNDTMLTAAHNRTRSPQWGAWPGAPGKDDKDKRIWHFSSPIMGGQGVQVDQVTCRASGMDQMEMTVFDHIKWGPVSFSSKEFEKEITLPLTDAFLIQGQRWLSTDGALDGSTRFWKQPSDDKPDLSFEYVFGYEFPWRSPYSPKYPFGSTPYPLSIDLKENFVAQNPADDYFKVSSTLPGADPSNALRFPSVRIIVVVTLVCCKESDYGLLNAGRFYPMIMVVSNRELDTVTGMVELARPAQNNMPEMMGEKMTKEIDSILFTDRNDKDARTPSDVTSHLPVKVAAAVSQGGRPELRWTNAFDYYDADPFGVIPGDAVNPDTYVLAYPHGKGNTQGVPNVQTSAYDQIGAPRPRLFSISPRIGLNFPLQKRTVYKMLGQGAYDNIHIAPKMILDKKRVQLSSYGKANDLKQDVIDNLDQQKDGFDTITMAPFCIHDCVHMHVRWTNWSPFEEHWGWDGTTSPNAVPGAPRVPANQKITLKLLSRSSVQYKVEAQKVVAGEWQIMLHHGAAYSLSDKFLFGTKGHNEISSVCDDTWVSGTWAMFYWNLRWFIDEKGVKRERLTFSPADLKTLREFVAK